MERWRNCVAVVTGASSGIGEACASDLVKAGLRVVALGRRIDRINENRSKLPEDCQDHFYPRKCDITSEAGVKQTFDWIEETLGGTDILVNSADCNFHGNLLGMNTQLMDKTWNTNVKGLIYCTRAAFRSMKRRNFAGHLVHININSVIGQKVINFGKGKPSYNVYPPSKFAVTAINEVVRIELNNFKTKIKTTSIHPGFVDTEILSAEERKRLNGIYLKPTDVSNTVLYAISTPPNVLILELTVKPVGEWF